MIKIPCPVCIIDGFLIASCRFFGVPDAVTSFFLGALTFSLAVITLRWLKKEFSVDTSPKGSLVFIFAVYSVLTLLAMRYLGMF